MSQKLFAELNTDGIANRLIFLDIDGTLTNDSNHELDNATVGKIKELAAKNKVYFCSNLSNCARNQNISQQLGIPYLDNSHKKPSSKILSLAENKENLPLLVIGDKFLTDGLFARNIGAEFIKVKRIFSTGDSGFSRALYFVDDALIKMSNHKIFLLILAAATIIWALVIGYLKYQLYQKGVLTSDMALYPNILWNTNFSGDILFNKIYLDWYGYKTFLNEHFSPTLVLLAPLYRLWPHPLLLVFLQTAAAAGAAWLVFILAKQLLKKDWLALVLALAYLLHPSLIAATIDNVYGFHHDVLFLPLVLLAALFLFRKQLFFFGFFLVLLLGLKENMPLAGVILGAELLFFKDWRKYGAVALAASGVFLATGLFLFPWLTQAPSHHAASVFELIKNLSAADFLASAKSLSSWLVLLLFFSAVFAPEILLLGAVDLGMYFLARKLPFYHHVFFVYALVVVAAIVGLKKMLTKKFFLDFIGTKLGRLALMGLPIIILLFLAGDIFVAGQYLALEKKFSWRKIDKAALDEAKKQIPDTVCLAVTSDLAIYFVNRRCLSWSDKSIASSDYLLINKNAVLGFDYDADFIRQTESLKLKPIWQKGEMVLFKK